MHKAGRLAGRLVREGDDVTFTYLADYLETDGPPVAVTLPATSDTTRATAGAVPPFFAGLLGHLHRCSSARPGRGAGRPGQGIGDRAGWT